MSDLNVVVIEGRLTKAAELSYFADGTAYSNFSIANNETFKNQDGSYGSVASYFDCTIKGKYAEAMVKHLLKGRAVKVVGRLKQQRWSKDGQNYSKIVLKCDEIHPAPIANGTQNRNFTPAANVPIDAPTPTEEYIPFESDGEDIPF